MPEPIQTCDIDIRVRYAEVDPMGYLHHAHYFVYFEMGRTELLRQNGIRYRDMEARGLHYAVARLNCRFRTPARYDEVLTLTTTTERLARVCVEHSYKVRRGPDLLTEGGSTLVCVGPDGHATALPDELYNRLVGVAPGLPVE